jgi:hypothetical protein
MLAELATEKMQDNRNYLVFYPASSPAYRSLEPRRRGIPAALVFGGIGFETEI